MKTKTKLLYLIVMMSIAMVMVVVGVFAVKTTTFQVGGNITFNAKGINATISQGSLTDCSFKDSSVVVGTDKLKAITINTDKTASQIESEFASWQGLDLKFNDDLTGNTATLTFSITNNATSVSSEYILASVSVLPGTSTNATVSVTSPSNYASLYIEPMQTVDYTITFTITDTSANASLSGFAITFNLVRDVEELVLDESEYPMLQFTYYTSTNTASVKGYGCKWTGGGNTVVREPIPQTAVTAKGSDDTGVVGSGGTTSPSGDVVIPSKVKYNGTTYTVTSVEDYGFYDSGITSITIPSSVTSVGSAAFSGSTGLTSMNYLGTLAQWCGISFSNLGSNPTYYTKVLIINGETLSGAITIPDGVTSIGHLVFHYCTGLTSITIPSSVTKICCYAFTGCDNLTSVTFKNTSGWTAGSTSLSSSNLSNTSTAATYLVSSYNNSIWKRS
jgi:hypothetical protein